MTTQPLTNVQIDRFLADVGDTGRRYFVDSGRIAAAFQVAGGDYHAAVARGLFWLYQDAVNVPADMAGTDPDQHATLIRMRKDAYEAWLKMPPSVEGVDETGAVAPTSVSLPLLFGSASAYPRGGC